MRLQDVLIEKGYSFQNTFTARANDIDFESEEDLAFALGYILGHANRIDAEIPEQQIKWIREIIPNYPIYDGTTISGDPIKWGRQYRIYFDTTRNMPNELRSHLQHDSHMRMTGSQFIESLFYVGFMPGAVQDENMIRGAFEEIFDTASARQAFENGYDA